MTTDKVLSKAHGKLRRERKVLFVAFTVVKLSRIGTTHSIKSIFFKWKISFKVNLEQVSQYLKVQHTLFIRNFLI